RYAPLRVPSRRYLPGTREKTYRKVFLPMPMPRMATVSLEWRGMGRAPLLGSAPRSTLGDCGEHRRSIPLGDLDTVQSADLKADMRLVGGRAQRYRPNAC